MLLNTKSMRVIVRTLNCRSKKRIETSVRALVSSSSSYQVEGVLRPVSPG
jgi:hypothetical protein